VLGKLGGHLDARRIDQLRDGCTGEGRVTRSEFGHDRALKKHAAERHHVLSDRHVPVERRPDPQIVDVALCDELRHLRLVALLAEDVRGSERSLTAGLHFLLERRETTARFIEQQKVALCC
jgi:hypothetical protein